MSSHSWPLLLVRFDHSGFVADRQDGLPFWLISSNRIFFRSHMPRFILLFALPLLLAACVDSNAPQKVPPHDPPDYQGVPTDTVPPDMTALPASASKASPQ